MMAKVTKLCSLLHTTCGLKEAFEAEFGVNSSVPAAVSTRWNSILRLVKAVTDLNQQSPRTQGALLITKGMEPAIGPFCPGHQPYSGGECGDSQCCPSLCTVTQLSSAKYTEHKSSPSQSSKSIAAVTQTLIQGVLVNVRMEHSDYQATKPPFGDNVYIMAAQLDPSFCLFWLDHDVLIQHEDKAELKESLIDLVLAEARKVAVTESSSGEEEQPPAKTSRMFSGYCNKISNKKGDIKSVRAEIIRFIQVSSVENEVECLHFWRIHAKVFPRLKQVAMTALFVPATSVPVVRVFSHEGLIMCLHRARLSARTLTT
ncbi:uncharacterized protein LOC115152425 [Salmo trutta]|uniref:uncharacterized protein LOC115152425 n=1 Tax=Salmo trutta TaxID=8032 RepID=UPI0011305DF2|nr:uncharacterized protein LOC115152425 [Salmo trutta]